MAKGRKETGDLDNLDRQIQELEVKKNLLLEKSLTSTNAHDIIKAQEYLSKKEKSNGGTGLKAYAFSPEMEFYDGMGYKRSVKSISFDLMRKMSYTPFVNPIISTRVEQVNNFSEFTTDLQKEGWTIRRIPNRFEDKTPKLTDQDKEKIDYIATFLEQGGHLNKWDRSSDFDDFLREQVQDSLTFDQCVFEIERTRGGKLNSYSSVDASTIRLLENIDPDSRNKLKFDEVNGYPPYYAQVYNGNIVKRKVADGVFEQVVFYPFEMSFGIRNKSTNMRQNGYGKSELEILVDIISFSLYGIQYNGNFFKQGSAPRGFFTIEGNVDQGTLNNFRQMWRNMASGWMNSHKTLVFESGKDGGIKWNDMHGSNKDMEFQEWIDFLILMTCSIYKIDPSELGFNFQKQAQVFGQDGQKERLSHSKNKGLKPLLIFLQQKINKYIVSEIDPAYEFVFTGIDLEDESSILENDIKKLGAGLISLEDGFMKYNDRKFDPKKDTILNQVYLQAAQMKQFGGEESNAAVDEMTGEPDEGMQNPFEEVEKAENDPFIKGLNGYITRELGN